MRYVDKVSVFSLYSRFYSSTFILRAYSKAFKNATTMSESLISEQYTFDLFSSLFSQVLYIFIHTHEKIRKCKCK